MIKGIYKHYKGGLFEVLGTALRHSDKEIHVIYRQMYGEKTTWIRPHKEFTEFVAKDKLRFERIITHEDQS